MFSFQVVVLKTDKAVARKRMKSYIIILNNVRKY